MSRAKNPLGSVFRGVFFSSCRTDLIQSELCSPDPGAPPKYHSMFVGPIEKNLDGLEAETTRFCQVWRQKAQSRILENTCLKAKNQLVSVFRGAFFCSCRTDLIQSALCSPDPDAPPKYPQYVCRAGHIEHYFRIYITDIISSLSSNVRFIHEDQHSPFHTI